jgi:hypothetical protein
LIDGDYKSSGKRGIVINGKYVPFTYTDYSGNYRSSFSANEIYMVKQSFATDVMTGNGLGYTPSYKYTNEEAIPSGLKYANGDLISLRPKVRADWWIDPVNPFEVLEMARSKPARKEDFDLAARDIVLAAILSDRKGRVRGGLV